MAYPEEQINISRNGNRHVCLIMGIKKAHAIMLSNNRCPVGMDYHHFLSAANVRIFFLLRKENSGKMQNYCYISE